jgi:hypothetical protein
MAKSVIRISWNQTALLPYKAGIPTSKQYQKNYQGAKWAELEKALMFAVLMEAVETINDSRSPRRPASKSSFVK